MASDQPILMTEEEKRNIEMELDTLINVKRPEIAVKIGRAAADGDLTENGAYHDAKEQQGHLEGRIQELEYLLRNAIIVTPSAGEIGLGNTVRIEDDAGNQRTYRLVSKHSAKPSEGLISDESPLGAALIGHTAGEQVTYKTPTGATRTVKILAVE
jgi:transcription elongation factor GreA